MGNFWEEKSLWEMTSGEWESLCDGCGKCCLHKLEDEDTGEIGFTNVACKLLDIASCRCSNYAARQKIVPDCVRLTANSAGALPWLPESCAYRKLARGEALEAWHPLLSGDHRTVHSAGISVRDSAVNESDIDDLEAHITDWLKAGHTPFSGDS